MKNHPRLKVRVRGLKVTLLGRFVRELLAYGLEGPIGHVVKTIPTHPLVVSLTAQAQAAALQAQSPRSPKVVSQTEGKDTHTDTAGGQGGPLVPGMAHYVSLDIDLAEVNTL